MGRDGLIGHSYPNTPVPELPADQERLLYLSNVNGYLTGRNSVLENDNDSLRRRVAEQEGMIKSCREQNDRLQSKIDEWSDKYFEADKERNRLRQYEPKDEITEGWG